MIRPARVGEDGVVRDVVMAAYERYVAIIGTAPGPMLDDYAARIADAQVWVVEDAGDIAGVLVLEDGPDRFLLDNVAVLPDRQGSGYGRMLLDFAEAECARRGWETVVLYTNALMAGNIKIYADRGYFVRERRIEKGFDRVYMEKHLGQD